MVSDGTHSNGLLHSEAPLTTSYTPDEPIGRDTELSRLIEALRPLANRRMPENLLLYGPAGVGKSVCVNHAFEQLESETAVETVYINCWQYNTRSSLLAKVLINLGYPTPRKGKPVDELLSRLREWLDKTENIAVALDEFDQLQEQNEIIYDLQHLGENAENNFGVVLVSNKHPTEIQLDPRSESRFSCKTLEFRPYTADRLYEILERRADQAFHPDTISDEVLEHVATEVAEQSGDCRQALELLLRAGRKAEQANADQVTREHVASENTADSIDRSE